ncbi:hypothetical protein [Ralstonia solanacearum]|uniref:hypothetical protein n=1 Tax=Ralstonia solanacearum TaxID=305 RepID=UPI003CC6428E
MQSKRHARLLLAIAGSVAFQSAFAADVAMGNSTTTVIALALGLGTLGGLLILGAKADLLRDPPRANATGARPFSLGRVQMAWWFAIIVWSYLYIWAQTGSPPALSPTLLSLAGISGATGVASVAIADTQQTTSPAHVSFFWDLTTDKNGPTLHRFQMLAMTVILGVVFIVNTVKRDALPLDFDGTTLGLLGISAGTYLGFKIPEGQ